MHKRRRLILFTVVALALHVVVSMQAQEDGGARVGDGGGSGVLESLYVPNFSNAPFSLTLHTEWIQNLRSGGTFTEVNERPIMRDSAGRIYMERWLLVPKGSGIRSQMSAIQIDDPVANKYYVCFPRPKVCELRVSVAGLAHYDPSRLKSGPLKSGKGSFLHEDLGEGTVAGVRVHAYRDTTTFDAGTLGNDVAMATVREFRYSEQLGLNLSSVLDAAQVGRQVFTVDDLSLSEPDPRFFLPPDGYRIVDKRKPVSAAP